jgi:hypothetical protein
MTKDELLALLETTSTETGMFFDLADTELTKSYGAGKWNVRQILHHLKKIIAEPNQVVWANNQDEWDATFDYRSEPLGNKKQVYEVCRVLNRELTEKYFDGYGQKEFVHSAMGLRKLKDEFEKVAIHNRTHNEQIKKALLQ